MQQLDVSGMGIVSSSVVVYSSYDQVQSKITMDMVTGWREGGNTT
jgi:hypothetical protein